MKTRRSLKPGQPLLVGHLVILDLNLRSTASHLGVDVWCPHCHRSHNHGWEDLPFRLDAVSHRNAHCPHGSPFDVCGYHVGLDPSAAGLADHKRVIREFKGHLQRWHARPAHPLTSIPLTYGPAPVNFEPEARETNQ